MKIRAIFISDLHLGSRYSRCDDLLKVLDKYKPEMLYLVGDIFDGWKLRRRWKFVNKKIIQKILKMACHGVKVKYVVGNHDAFLLDFCGEYGIIEIQESFVHITKTGKRILVTHGNEFDSVECRMSWLSKSSNVIYDFLLGMNGWLNWALGRKGFGFCGFLKSRVKALVQICSGFNCKLRNVARQFDGLICGHIHCPVIEEGEFMYGNTGDWVEHSSVLIEHKDGTWELRT